jgi:hypothetical protein
MSFEERIVLAKLTNRYVTFPVLENQNQPTYKAGFLSDDYDQDDDIDHIEYVALHNHYDIFRYIYDNNWRVLSRDNINILRMALYGASVRIVRFLNEVVGLKNIRLYHPYSKCVETVSQSRRPLKDIIKVLNYIFSVNEYDCLEPESISNLCRAGISGTAVVDNLELFTILMSKLKQGERYHGFYNQVLSVAKLNNSWKIVSTITEILIKEI